MRQRVVRISCELLAGGVLAMVLILIGIATGEFIMRLANATSFQLRILGLPIYHLSRHAAGWLNLKAAQQLGVFCALALVLVVESCEPIWHPAVRRKF